MEPIKPPVQALGEAQLETVSGGSTSPTEAISMVSLGIKTGEALAAAIVPAIDAITFQKTYGKAMDILATYNNSTRSIEEKVNYYVASWNEKHSNDPMDLYTASIIISLGVNPELQVKVACQPSVDAITNEINALQNAAAQ